MLVVVLIIGDLGTIFVFFFANANDGTIDVTKRGLRYLG